MIFKKNYLIFFIIVLLFINRKKTYFSIDKKIGRGIFCNNIIFPGEIIEISPTIEIEKIYNNNPIQHYLFTDKKYNYVGFGLSSMFNHSDNPNVIWYFNKDKEIVFKATTLILCGQQLLINYGKKYWQSRNDKYKK
tara:strand:- start:3723 stop:4130 length:408 start_codon:yes stop_codon:yes gene_type:complete